MTGNKRTDGKTWESVLERAEQYAFFKGSIRFLFQNEVGEVDWGDFDEKWKSAQKYFLEKTTQESVMQENYKNADLLKQMIGWFTKDTFSSILWWWHRTFNNKPETWLYYLLNSKNCRAIHHLMKDERCDESIKFQNLVGDEKTIYILANTALLDYVIVNIPNSWIRNYHNHIAIYPSSQGVFLNADKRDNLLSTTGQIKIEDEHKINNTTFLFGSDINFTFSNHYFQWYRDDIVYLLDENGGYSKKKSDEYFSFDTEAIQDSDGLISKLNELIDDYNNQ